MPTTSAQMAFRVAVENAFKTAWVGAGYPASSINFANTEFDPTEPSQAIWASLSIKYGMSMENTMGGTGRGSNQLVGVVFVQVFVPQATGTGPLITATDVVRDCFQRKRIGNGVFGAPSGASQPTADSEMQQWQMSMVSAGFWYEDFL